MFGSVNQSCYNCFRWGPKNPNLSCASAFVRQSQTFHSINALCTHIFKLTKHSIGRYFPCTVRTYNQDLVLVVVALCISYAPKVFSHCSRCCCCLLVYDRQGMGIHLNSARGPGLTKDYDLCLPAFTLNPFFSMASFQIKSLLTHSSRESAMMTRSSA